MSDLNGDQPLLDGATGSGSRGPATKLQRIRAKAHDMVEGSIDTWFEYSLLFVIFVNVLALIFSSIRVSESKPWCVSRHSVTASCQIVLTNRTPTLYASQSYVDQH
jgi:hypothetical protein